MKKFQLLLFFVLINSSYATSEDSINITCVAQDFSRYFKLTLSDDIKVHWESHYGYEPKHENEDVITDTAINSCINISNQVACMYMNRTNGKFVYTQGDPEYSHANFPAKWAWYPNTERYEGRCEVGQKKVF